MLMRCNLSWALRELAEVSTRRMIYRARILLNIASARREAYELDEALALSQEALAAPPP